MQPNKYFIIIAMLFFLFTNSCKRNEPALKENEFYVCSMDPQVVEKQAGMCPICKMPLAKTIIDKTQLQYIKINEEQAKLANIKTEKLTVGNIGKEVLLSGIFSVNQNKTEQVSARIGGRVDYLNFKIVGSEVKAGEKLYDFYSRELFQAQEEFLLALEKSKLLQLKDEGISNAARNKLLLWGMTENQINELTRTKKAKITVPVFAKMSGTITQIPLKDGDYVEEGMEIYQLADLHTIWVEAQLYTNEINLVKEGDVVDITPEAYPDEIIKGKVVYINPELQNGNQVNLVRIEVSNQYLKYKPGMQVYVSLKTEKKPALVLPLNGLVFNQGKTIAFVEKQRGVFEPRRVTTGLTNKDKIEIVDGLKENEIVVTSGAYLLYSEYVFKRGKQPFDKDEK
jgi:Cu(I)/Ag(I) efflux system membrane fusion protein